MPTLNDPTTGFQLSALPQAFNVPSNIGKFDVGQTQQAYANSLKNIQNTALVGPETAAAVSQAKYNQMLANEGMKRLPAETQALLSKYGYEQIANENKKNFETGMSGYQGDIGKYTGAFNLQDLSNKFTTGNISSAAIGAPVVTTPKSSLLAQPPANTGTSIADEILNSKGIQSAAQKAEQEAKDQANPENNIPATEEPEETPETNTAPNQTAPANVANAVTSAITSAAPSAGTTTGSNALPSLASVPPTTPSVGTNAFAALSNTPSITPSSQATGNPPVTQQAQAVSNQQAQAATPKEEAGPYSDIKVLPNGNFQINGVSLTPQQLEQNANLIRQGFRPQGNLMSWHKIDWDNGYEQTSGPGGIGISKPTSIPKDRMDLYNDAKSAVMQAKLIDPTYQTPEGVGIGAIKEDAMDIASAPTLQNPNHAMPAPNPAMGIYDPKEAAKVRTAAYKQGNSQMTIADGMQSNIAQVTNDLQEFQNLNHSTSTGPVSSLITPLLASGQNVQAFINSLAQSPDANVKKQAALAQSHAVDLEAMKNIHDRLVTEMLRLGSSSNTLGAPNASGGPSGLGRIMNNELGWIAAASPNPTQLTQTNDIVINDALSRLDRTNDLIDYAREYNKDYHTIEGAGDNFQKYANENPYFVNGKSNPNRTPWQQVLMSDEWNKAHPAQQNSPSSGVQLNNRTLSAASAPQAAALMKVINNQNATAAQKAQAQDLYNQLP